jgi:hypothetical protein
MGAVSWLFVNEMNGRKEGLMAFEVGPTKSSTDTGYAAAGSAHPPTFWQIVKNATVPTLAGYEVSLGMIGMTSSIYFLACAALNSFITSTAVALDTSLPFLSTTGLAWSFYLLAIVAGLLLSHRKQSGKNLSIIVHVIQIPVVAIGGIKYAVSLSGISWPFVVAYKAKELSVAFLFSNGPPEFFNKFGSHAYFFMYPSDMSVVGVNILAIILVVLFAKVQIR